MGFSAPLSRPEPRVPLVSSRSYTFHRAAGLIENTRERVRIVQSHHDADIKLCLIRLCLEKKQNARVYISRKFLPYLSGKRNSGRGVQVLLSQLRDAMRTLRACPS